MSKNFFLAWISEEPFVLSKTWYSSLCCGFSSAKSSKNDHMTTFFP